MALRLCLCQGRIWTISGLLPVRENELARVEVPFVFDLSFVVTPHIPSVSNHVAPFRTCPEEATDESCHVQLHRSGIYCSSSLQSLTTCDHLDACMTARSRPGSRLVTFTAFAAPPLQHTLMESSLKKGARVTLCRAPSIHCSDKMP